MKIEHPKYFATKNENKLREIREILGNNIQRIQIDLLEPQEIQVEKVVRKKAEEAFKKIGKVVLVEDTGLEFAAWNGLPGALIKWFLETVGNEGILNMLQNEKNRIATAKTAIGFFDGKRTHIFTGEIQGEVTKNIRGNGGFGWDSIFIPNGHSKSFAEMTPPEKNAISMRKKALENMKERFKQSL